MGYFRDAAWGRLIGAFDDWSEAVLHFCYGEGTYPPSTDCYPPPELIDGVLDLAKMDPAPINAVYCLVETWFPTHGQSKPSVPTETIYAEMLRCRLIRDRLLRLGIVAKRPSQAAAPTPEAIAKAKRLVKDKDKHQLDYVLIALRNGHKTPTAAKTAVSRARKLLARNKCNAK